jgi:predicted RNase H-like nuclease (RuvC/YqgF family)
MKPLDTNKPMEAIEEWQKWYRKNRVVAEMDEPLVTKDSREKLHDTSNTTTTLDGSNNLLTDYCKAMSFQKAKEYFADTIAEFANELSGKELYKAFYSAAMENMDCVEKEYNRAKQLVDMLRYKEDA